MKKIKMSTLKIIIVVAVMLVFTMNVLAASASGALSGTPVSASNSITSTSAYAQTTVGSFYYGASVNGTYYYINPSTMTTGSEYKSNSGQSGASISFSATSGNRSVKIVSNHKVTIGNQTWTVNNLTEIY